MFGPYERRVADVYRALYFDVDAFITRTREWNPNAKRILEVGCGEGAVTERLRIAYPQAEITALDVSSRLGRLYSGSRNAVRFVRCTVQEIAAVEPGQHDMVILCDVLHHVPKHVRQELLDAIREAMAPGGILVVKEWERIVSPIHWLCYASDRWLTGDRISYMNRGELREYLAQSFGEATLIAEARVDPWRNNIATLVQL
jgi:2-polyprenyl-6-hydroxyphenyl methylase/3-demethylubiquinone-9 3-methyltransferase